MEDCKGYNKCTECLGHKRLLFYKYTEILPHFAVKKIFHVTAVLAPIRRCSGDQCGGSDGMFSVELRTAAQ